MEQFIERKLSGKLRSKQVGLLIKRWCHSNLDQKGVTEIKDLFHSEVCVGRTSARVESQRQGGDLNQN